MNRVDFNAKMNEIILSLNGKRPRLLLHACCAPCSSACLERLHGGFDVTALFYNPNIEDEEYLKRKAELIRFIDETGWAEIADCDRDKDKFYEAARGLENEREGGARCEACFKLRLGYTAERAKEGNYDYFATTLTLSPLKNAALINAVGEAEGKRLGVSWLYNDFKKADGYLRSLQLSKEHNLYRQNYCGCVFSKAQRGANG